MRSRWEVPDGVRVQAWVLEPGAGTVRPREGGSVPPWAAAERGLPELVWDGHPEMEQAAATAWRLAWDHLRAAEPDGPFAAPYLESAFNGQVFLWDAAFAARFLVLARNVVDVPVLDGFYIAQSPDGWISRTLAPDGTSAWERHDPSSTGPNVLAWTELVLAERSGDLDRLRRVLPALVAYHRWTRRYRTWPDGTYWSTGWGCGMDGLPRLPHGVDPNFEHGGVTWVDATLQALLSARSLLAAQDKVGSTHDLADLQSEARRLQASVDDLWDEQVGAYTDRGPGGASAGVLHVGTYWALLAGAADGGRQARLLTHLTDENALGTPVPVPALSRSHPHFQDDGGYWLGGVWTPTTLMVLDGLHAVGAADLAHALGRRHVEAVARVVADTGTIWENWSPMRPAPGHDARPNFVGWGGASAITVALEHLLGLRPCGDRLTWDVRLLERHGVRRLPVGKATLDLVAAERAHSGAEPQLQARTDAPVTLDLTWRGGRRTVHLTPGADLDEH